MVRAVDTDHCLFFDKDPFSTNVEAVVVADTGEHQEVFVGIVIVHFRAHFSPWCGSLCCREVVALVLIILMVIINR